MNITTEQISSLLGRELTSNESANFEQNLEIVENKLKQVLCLNLSCGNYTRQFRTRDGFRTLYVDPFTSIKEVKVDGVVTDDYVTTFNGEFNSCFYDGIEFDEVMKDDKIVTVKANWGIQKYPYDLLNFIARLFAIVSDTDSQTIADNSNIKTKSIDGFSVTYKGESRLATFYQEQADVISKYGHCSLACIKDSVDVQPL